MLATRTNKNEREQLNSGYVSVMKIKLLPKYCSFKCVDNLAAKKWEREISCNQTWAKIQWKPEQECERECEWVCEHERAQHPSLGLYLKWTWCVHPRRASHNGQGAVADGVAQDRWPWVGRPQGGPPGAPLWPDASSTVICLGNVLHVQSLLERDVQIIFQRILKLKKYFWYFYKKKKVLGKIPACRKNIFVLLVFNLAVEKIQKGGRTKWRKN